METAESDLNISSGDTDINCALEEYKILWDYYKVTLVERRALLEWYFKIVALPAAAIAAVLSQTFDKKVDGLNLNYAMGFMLLVIFFSGVSLFLTYTHESVNATKYFKQIVNIRKFFIKNSSNLSQVFYIGGNDNHKVDATGFDFIKITKGMTIPIINSAIGLMGIVLVSSNYSTILIAITYIILIFIHIFIHSLIFKKTNFE